MLITLRLPFGRETVVSIPIIVLKISGLKLAQKVGIAVFLCLSIVMIIITLIRMIGSIRPSLRSKHDGDITWQIFWQYMVCSTYQNVQSLI